MMTRGRMAKAVNEFIGPYLEPGEAIEATLSSARAGPSYWTASARMLIPGRGIPMLLAIVVTDRRVLLIHLSDVSLRPMSLEASYLRAEVTAARFTSGPLSGTLRLEVADRPPFVVNVKRSWRGDAARVAEALRRRA